nr:metal-dependent hydrolase [Candidatus Sigynarchaeota archaeon]
MSNSIISVHRNIDIVNEFTHFVTGYLFARALKYRESRFEAFFMAACALVIDIDSTINIFIPFEHGVITHTIAGGFLLVLAFTAISYAVAAPLLRKTATSFKRLLLLGIIGMLSHFLLDSFTYYETTADAIHHLYFWPLWNFPVHINTIFPFGWMTYDVRVWVEVLYTVSIVVVLLVQLFFKKQNFFLMFIPSRWMGHASTVSNIPEGELPVGAVQDRTSRRWAIDPLMLRLALWEILTMFVFSLQYFA